MIRAVLFDLDGTLLHSAPDLVAALNWVRQSHGLPELPLAQMESSAGRGALGLLKAGMPAADEATVERWRLAFLDRYEQFSYRDSTLYDGVADLLAHLEKGDRPWGVVTNKPEYLTFPILESAGLADSVGCVVCGDTLEERKPHPAPVLLACERLGVAPAETVFVGDDVRDIEAGRAAGVATCAALYGYGADELLKPDHAHLLDRAIAIRNPAELIGWLERGSP